MASCDSEIILHPFRTEDSAIELALQRIPFQLNQHLWKEELDCTVCECSQATFHSQMLLLLITVENGLYLHSQVRPECMFISNNDGSLQMLSTLPLRKTKQVTVPPKLKHNIAC